MKNENMKTLPVTRGSKLEGMITIGDIAESYMEVYDNHILSMSKTQYRNIANTMDGTFVTGNEHSYFVNGKVMVAASEVSHMEEVIEKDDMVIGTVILIFVRKFLTKCDIRLICRIHKVFVYLSIEKHHKTPQGLRCALPIQWRLLTIKFFIHYANNKNGVKTQGR